jgi:two-component sensor histidine kinase
MGAAGPEVWLAPKRALGLALALHELATNAAKHGALSRPEGRVALRWRQDEEAMVTLEWSEGGGPPVRQPGRRGFGTRLLERGMPTELGPGAAVSLHYQPAGLTATIRFRGQRAEADDVAAAAKAPQGRGSGSA